MKRNHYYGIWGGILLVLLLTACVSNKSFDETFNDIKEQEATRIASINEQISSINSSLSSLSSTDANLKALIEELEHAKEALNAAVQDNDTKIDSVRKELEQEASSAKQDLLDQLNTIKAELQGKLDAINLVLDDLKEKDAELEEQIKTLSNYVNTELKNTKDWAQATFSTLEQYNATVEEIAGIKADIDAVNKSIKELETRIDEKIAADIAEAVSALTSKIQKLSDDVYAKIAESVEDLKNWVNTQLTSYYTIAEIDEKVKVLEKAIKDGDDASAAEIKKLKEELEDQKTTITDAYKQAISEAITTNNGVIDGKIQEAVDGVNGRIDTEVAAITEQLTTMFSRLDGIDASLVEIYGLLKKVYPTSIVIISESNVKMGFGKTRTIDFRVNPSEASFNFDVTSEDCEIELDYLGENATTRAGYVTTPNHITLTKVEQMYDANLNKLKGQYRAYITDQRVQRKYNDRLGLVLTVPGNNGNDFQISSSTINVALSVGEITSFSFKVADNPSLLQDNLDCDINGGDVSARIPHLVPNKKLVPCITFAGEGKLVLHSDMTKDINALTDFSQSVSYDVIDEETGEVLDTYDVFVSSFTGLPVMWIETENRTSITSKEDYINATYRLEEDLGKITKGTMKIKGRGNSTWYTAPKKPYALKLDEKTSLLGEAKDKSWVLLANYFDMTMLRNRLAFYMGYISNLDYTAKAHFVEVMLNGKYNGTYQLCEKLKIGKNRVNVGDDGFLFEIDSRAPSEGDPYFSVTHLPTVVNIKDPDVTIGDDNYNYAQDYLAVADNALFSDSFTDPVNGWQKYMDLDSFVDFYIINEIAKNGDVCCFYTSCYMNLKREGKLKMGPIWDNDNSYGKSETPEMHPVEGWYLKETEWYTRLFQDPAFVNRLKERYSYFYSKKDDIMMDINENANYLKYAVNENNARWGTLYSTTISFSYNVWGSYQNEVQYLKDWLSQRMDWLNTEINKL